MIEESRFVNANENAIEFMRDGKYATVTLSKPSMINRVMKLAQQKPEEVRILVRPEYNNGYLYARVPVKWIKINPPKELSEETKKNMAERLRKGREE